MPRGDQVEFQHPVNSSLFSETSKKDPFFGTAILCHQRVAPSKLTRMLPHPGEDRLRSGPSKQGFSARDQGQHFQLAAPDSSTGGGLFLDVAVGKSDFAFRQQEEATGRTRAINR
jgi:hypothetical protein